MKVRFLQEAQHEFLDALEYYEEAEPGLGQRFRVELDHTVQGLCDHPETYRIRSGQYRRINLRTFPFYLPFLLRGEMIWGLAVAHESRRPHFWISRRPPALP